MSDDDAATETPDVPDDHDPTGTDLARRIAHSLRGRPPAAKRTTGKRGRSAGDSRPTVSRDPQLLGSALDKLIVNQGWQTRVNLHLLLSRWPALVGEVNAEHSTPETFADGRLTIRASSTAWATSLRTMSTQLKNSVNEQLGFDAITQVTVVGPQAPVRRYGPRSVRGRGPRDTYG